MIFRLEIVGRLGLVDCFTSARELVNVSRAEKFEITKTLALMLAWLFIAKK